MLNQAIEAVMLTKKIDAGLGQRDIPSMSGEHVHSECQCSNLYTTLMVNGAFAGPGAGPGTGPE